LWEHAREALERRDASRLSGDDLDRLADASFWTDDHDRSLAARRDAYRAHVAAGSDRRAAMSAWRLFYDHALIGEAAPAAGWLERCRWHVGRAADAVTAGWLAIADADRSLAAGNARDARDHASTARSVGVAANDADLTAMALQAEGRALLASGDRIMGMSRLDEAMVAVVNDELAPLFVGWVYCNVVAACHGVADLRRATEWSDAAMRWCETLREGKMFPGLCRVYAVEIAFLRGDWDQALAAAELACTELTSFEPRYAGTAFGLVGDLRRVRGDLAGADRAYRRADQLGVAVQPGLALLAHARGGHAAALRSLHSALTGGRREPLAEALLLDALATVATAVGDAEAARSALGALASITDGVGGLLDAMAAAAQADLAHRDGHTDEALATMRRVVTDLMAMGYPYEAARRRMRLADMARSVGDEPTAQFELSLAVETFEQLGAAVDLDIARRLARSSDDACPLTPRELEVLELVARGRTNDQVALDLVISVHTVARHMTNIRTKLGVSSRAAAVAAAVTGGWLTPHA
jgi:ATP/maltotriose-dependent transcriptional regulator MalT